MSHWSVPDPVAAGTDAAFDAAYDDIAGRVADLAPRLTPTASQEHTVTAQQQQHAPGRPGPRLSLDQPIALSPDTGSRG